MSSFKNRFSSLPFNYNQTTKAKFWKSKLLRQWQQQQQQQMPLRKLMLLTLRKHSHKATRQRWSSRSIHFAQSKNYFYVETNIDILWNRIKNPPTSLG